MDGGDSLCPIKGGGDEGVVGQQIDLSGQAAGGAEDGLDGVGFEDGEFGSGQAQQVGQIAGELVTREPGQVVPYDDALVEGLEDGL